MAEPRTRRRRRDRVGAGGAVAARTLALAGLRVIVVEEGRHRSTAELAARLPLDRLADLYRDGGATVALGNPRASPHRTRGGGTTLVNAGTCHRTPRPVLRAWRDNHGLDLADEAGFDDHLDRIEHRLNMAVPPPAVLGGNALRGAAELGWQAQPLRRNALGCKGSGQCVVGCPTGTKQSVQLSLLPDACAEGATIVTSARAQRLLVDPTRPAAPESAASPPCAPTALSSTRPPASPDASPCPRTPGVESCKA